MQQSFSEKELKDFLAKALSRTYYSRHKNALSLEEAIQTLKDFDDNTLFPYIDKLINTLENILQPSPMIF